MNDRYLFRAKRIDNGEWIYGNLLQTDDDGVCIIQNYVPHHLLKQYEINPDTICQCTGLRDKNGNLIWENDVVRDKYMKYRVIWSEEEGSWMLQTVSGAMYGIGGINSKKYEVI